MRESRISSARSRLCQNHEIAAEPRREGEPLDDPPAHVITSMQLPTALVIAVVFVAQTGAEAQQTAPKTRADRLAFAAGRVSFVPPPGFTAPTADEIAVKYPRGGPLAKR